MSRIISKSKIILERNLPCGKFYSGNAPMIEKLVEVHRRRCKECAKFVGPLVVETCHVDEETGKSVNDNAKMAMHAANYLAKHPIL